MATITNAGLSELLWRAGQEESGHRRQALERASRAARFWSEEASDLADMDRSLTELPNVGPWVGAKIHEWLDEPPPIPEPPEIRRGFLTLSQARRPDGARLGTLPHADLQMHTTDSDGSLPLRGMVEVAREIGRSFVITDHSQGLRIANGWTRRGCSARSGDRLNAELPVRAIRSVCSAPWRWTFPDGSSEPEALAGLDMVLGAFHRSCGCPTTRPERYLAALRNPDVQILAHPRARMFGKRVGLLADWSKVFDEAARMGKALELDATPARQDLDVELARLAMRSGVPWFSIGSDAHSAAELGALPFGLAIAALAEIPRDRILNYRSADFVTRWAAELRDARAGSV